MWCKNIQAFLRYSNFRVGIFYFASPCTSIFSIDCMTLIFDLLTPVLIVSYSIQKTTCANLNENRFIRFQNIVFTSLVTDERTEKWTKGKLRS